MRRPLLLSACALTLITAAVPMATSASAGPAPNSEFTIAHGAHDGTATLAVSEDGTAHVVWTVANPGGFAFRIRYCRVLRTTRACAETPKTFGADVLGQRLSGPPDVFLRGNDVSILTNREIEGGSDVVLLQSHDGGATFGAPEAVGNVGYSYSRHQGQAPDGSFWVVNSSVQRTQAGSFASEHGSLADGMAIDGDVVFESSGQAFAAYSASNGDERVYRLPAGTNPNATDGWQLAADPANGGFALAGGPLGVLLRSQTSEGSPNPVQIQHWNGSTFSAALEVPFPGGGNIGPMWQDAGSHLFLNYSNQVIVNTATSFKVLIHTDRNNYDSGDTAADGGGFLATTDGGDVVLLPIPATRSVTSTTVSGDIYKAVIKNGVKGQLVRLELKKGSAWQQVTTSKIGVKRTVSFTLTKSGTYRVTAPTIEGYSSFKGGSKSFKV